MKVLHVSGANAWGGNEQQLFDLIFGLKKLQVENAIFCFKESPVETTAKTNNIVFKSMPKTSAHSLKYAKGLYACVKQLEPDVIHLHTSNAVTAFVISDMLFKLKTPTVFSKKGISGAMSVLSRFKYNYKNINKIICVSEAVKNAFKTVLKPKNQHKLCVIYDGIKIERQENKSKTQLRKAFSIPDSTVIIGNIANHARAKDLVTLVKAANELVNIMQVKNVCFIQIGSRGKHTHEFVPLIKEYKLENNFILAGFQEHAMDLLSQMDIYVMSSEREGLPITIYEAFLKKVPVVSTKAGGIPEAITHNVNGLLADVKDYKTLAKNLKIVIENEDLQNKFSEKSYSLLFEKFTTTQLAKQTLTIYNDVTHN